MSTERRVISIKFILYFMLFVALISCDSAIQKEANDKAQEWWDESIANCNNNKYTKIVHNSIIIGGDIIPTVQDKPLIEFKNTNFILITNNLTDADKLNGVEWDGYVSFPPEFTFRFYDTKNNEWSSWRKSTMVYKRSKLEKTVAELLGDNNSPLIQELRKVNGKWNYERNRSDSKLMKPACSEIPGT